MASQRLLQSAQPSPIDLSRLHPGPGPRPVRKIGYMLACDVCRKSKKKCDRSRPACARCTERGLRREYLDGPHSTASTAQLERLAQLSRDPNALSDLLTTLPYFDALELFNMLREMPPRDSSVQASTETPSSSSSSSSSIPSSSFSISSFSSSPSSSPPSPLLQYNLVGSLLPPATNSLEQELMVWHPIAYPALMPIVASSLPLEKLLNPRRSDVLSAHLLHDAEPPDSVSPDMRIESRDDNKVNPDFYKKLSHLSPMHVSFLNQVDITSWTSLPIPNQIAVQVIALYLNNDYQVIPLFNMDLFLRDLSRNQPYFCSSLLVSALLGWACQAYTCMHPKAASWSSLFFLDAQAQWSRLGRHESVTLSSMSALQLLCMTSVTHGQDELALSYIRKGLELGKMMGLIDVASVTESAAGWLDGYPDWQRAASYTAWGAFDWALSVFSLFALHYHKTEVGIPPAIMMPGDIDLALAAQEGLSIRLPVNVQVFRASCKLWTIFAPVARIYYGQANDIFLNGNPALEYAENIYHELLTWAEELPPNLIRQPGNCHGVLMMHIYYHAVIVDLFRPFLHLTHTSSISLRTFNADHATPRMVYHSSIRQLKRLLLSYRMEFGLEALSVLWQTGVVYVVNATIRDESSSKDEMQFFMHLCLVGLEELSLSFRVFGSITRGVLGMAVRQGAIEQHQVRRARRRLKKIEQHFLLGISSDEIMARWMVDLDLAVTDPIHAQGGKLAEDFDRMSVHETRDDI
ncbi:hypothetical protein FOVG_16550 [Fusarium oxysporum f. sp. pisi HDV247]|uniref:Zn(2)-C6 fungal-type domain-containing protein n=2 Tax=Fusarium oxysporum f. sp. pisi HDV247 TaxID=1080344 RepID=W9NHJ4_FUSOX|nr:hypothetical protein FOVG_16550 [Fusarium oxysporum f. sp. pisi HDV247]